MVARVSVIPRRRCRPESRPAARRSPPRREDGAQSSACRTPHICDRPIRTGRSCNRAPVYRLDRNRPSRALMPSAAPCERAPGLQRSSTSSSVARTAGWVQGGDAAVVPAAPPRTRKLADSAPGAAIRSVGRDKIRWSTIQSACVLMTASRCQVAEVEQGGGRKTSRFRRLGITGGIGKGPLAGGLVCGLQRRVYQDHSGAVHSHRVPSRHARRGLKHLTAFRTDYRPFAAPSSH